ncbi:hypothetical protein GXW82_17580 [Streptacidiphilus sp. 4-A2]|nr:hypothetical protein [Streptacidiphilus sp. 4-A2]
MATSAPQDPHARVLMLDEVTARTAFIKCMGRTYTATALGDGRVALADATDITRPLALGTARRVDGDQWDVHTAEGSALLRTGDLLPALSALREAARPSRGQLDGHPAGGHPPARRRQPTPP